jgi:hypothetical protein
MATSSVRHSDKLRYVIGYMYGTVQGAESVPPYFYGGSPMTVANTKPLHEMTLPELKERAIELGVEPSLIEPLEASGEVPNKADWLRAVEHAEATRAEFKDEWLGAADDLLKLFDSVPGSEKVIHARKLAAALTTGGITNDGLVALRDIVRETAAEMREADKRDLANQFSNANYHIRRAERATRPKVKS